MAAHHRNQWTSTKAEDRARAEAKDMADFDFRMGTIAQEKTLWRMAESHVDRFKTAPWIRGLWARTYQARIAELREP